LTLGATTLLHEAWLRIEGRLLKFPTQAVGSSAVQVMRGIVIDHVRARQALRHGGEHEFVPQKHLARPREARAQHWKRH